MLSRRLECCFQNETPKNDTTPMPSALVDLPAGSPPARLRV
jgi:hypothetical protein